MDNITESGLQFLSEADPTTFFVTTLFLYAAAFPITDIVCRLISPKFAKYDHDRQYYIVSNVLKSFILSVVAWIFTVLVIIKRDMNPFSMRGMLENRTLMVNTSCLYCITDMVSLALNYRAMMRSTIAHHVAVTFVYFKIATADFSQEGIYKGMMMYGSFSSFAFLVNTYLGIRFIISKTAIEPLKKMALVSYVGVSFTNWFWQAYYICLLAWIGIMEEQYWNFPKIALMVTLINVWVKDDIILMKHLAKPLNPN